MRDAGGKPQTLFLIPLWPPVRLLLRRGGICCLYRLFRLRCCHQLRKGLLLRKPRLVVGGGIDDNGAAHLWVSDAAELGAENLEAAGARRLSNLLQHRAGELLAPDGKEAARVPRDGG